MDKFDLINSIKKNYKSVQEMKIENSQAFAVSIRSSLEFAVKLFWQERLGKIPTWQTVNGRQDFNLNEAIRDSQFSNYFERWTVTYMHLIRQDCNDIIHGHKDLTVGTAKELIENLEKCLKAIEKLLGYSLIPPVNDLPKISKEPPQPPKTAQPPKTVQSPKPTQPPATGNTGKNKITPTAEKPKKGKESPAKGKETAKARSAVLQKTKDMVLRFMQIYPECGNKGTGLEQSVIFDSCGLSWGNQENATERNQQYWLVSCLKELETEWLVESDTSGRYWRLTARGAEKKVDISEFSGLKVRQAGEKLRSQAKACVYESMKSNSDCGRYGEGVSQLDLFRRSGLVWDEYGQPESAYQLYWFIGLIQSLEKEGWIRRDSFSQRWRLK